VRTLIKKPLRPAFTALKQIWRPVRRWTIPHGLILMYHRVARPRTDPWKLCVSPENFRDHLELLCRYARVVPLTELPRRLSRAGRNNRPPVAITFDDGYVDNLEQALPALQHFAAPATLFVATSWIGSSMPFWSDTLAATVLESQVLPEQLELQMGTTSFQWRRNGAQGAGAREALLRSLWARLQVLDEVERSAALERVTACFGGKAQLDPTARPMTVEEVRKLHASGVFEIGAHTMTHPSLPTLSPEQQMKEISGSRMQCERWTGAAPAAFAYPYGDFDARSAAIVADSGFSLACSAKAELVWEYTSRYLLPRVAVSDWNARQFERQLRQVWLS